MIVIAGGDSFVYGSELLDCNSNPSNNTFTALLAKSIGADYICTAEPGNANNAISRQVMNSCEKNKDKNLFVVVMWTFVHRYEFRFNYNTHRRTNPWHSINLWDIVDDMASLKKELNSEGDPGTFDAHVSNRLMQEHIGLTDFAKTFYKHVGNNEYYEVYTSLKEMLYLQQYLTLNNIPFLFVPADSYLENNDHVQRHKNDTTMLAIYNQIDWEHWYTFPKGTKTNETQFPRGFYQWAVENKYPIGTTHPLEQAHVDASKLMQEKFNELVKKHI